MIFIGLFYWNLFYAIVNYGSNVLINQEHIIKKIYFPREIIIISSCFVQCFDSFIVFIFLLLNIIYYKVNFNFFYNFYNFILVFIIGIIITIIYALSLSFILSILHGKYKDIRFVTPFILQLLLFLTPVVYSSSIITGHYSFLFSIHPIAITIEQTRNLIGNQNINYYPLFLSFFFGIVILIISIGFFRNKIANSIDEL